MSVAKNQKSKYKGGKMAFANIRNNEIIDFNSKYMDTDIVRIEVSDELYQAYNEDSAKVIYKDGAVVLNPGYEAEKAQAEAERTANLSLTAADVERALYKAFGKDFDDIVAMVETLQSSSSHSELNTDVMLSGSETSQGANTESDSSVSHSEQSEESQETSGNDMKSSAIDIKALKIELKANNFYRGNAYVDAIGTLLGITPAQLDEFFETNDYTKLLPADDTADEEEAEVTETTEPAEPAEEITEEAEPAEETSEQTTPTEPTEPTETVGDETDTTDSHSEEQSSGQDI